ncbi:MAG: DUF4386 family protein [Candidatus Thorarchaeota archaeon]
MNAQNTMDDSDKWMYKVGGISGLVVFVGYFIIIALYIVAFPPNGTEEKLIFFAEHATEWWSIIGLSVLTNFLRLLVFFSLYLALKGINRNAALIAVAFEALFVVLECSTSYGTLYPAFMNLSSQYATATSDAQRAIFVTVATYVDAALNSGFLGIYAVLVPAISSIVISFVMLKGIFNKATAYLGFISGILAIVSVVGAYFISALSNVVIIASMLSMVWFLLLGYRLYRLGQGAN